MTVLLIGGGGREHAIAWKLSQSPRVTKLFCAPGNGGIAQVAECVPIQATDIEKIVTFAKKNAVDFVVVAPDDPLAMGLVDACTAAGLRAFGPTQAAARIESSKIFSKNLMRKYGIPTAAYETFDDCQNAVTYARKMGATPYRPLVIKADGLALGKGVVLAGSVAEAEDTLREMMEGDRFRESGRRVVIEEFLRGREVTVLCFTDGKTVLPMPSSRDHKRAFDGDAGPNTGGMGVIAPVADYTPKLARQCMDEIFLPTIRAMEAEGNPFSGVIYFGLMLTDGGPKVIEYNARFGDPEAQAVLMLLESDLFEVLEATAAGRLDGVTPVWSDSHCACVVMASGGYPAVYKTGFPITGLDALPDGIRVFHAGTARSGGGGYITSGGRVLSVCATAASLDTALDKAYSGVGGISFEGEHHRTDIGKT